MNKKDQCTAVVNLPYSYFVKVAGDRNSPQENDIF